MDNVGCTQVASGMWPLLTLNVESLPHLPLEQWQTIFGVIACTAAGDSFSALKSFEVRRDDLFLNTTHSLDCAVYGVAPPRAEAGRQGARVLHHGGSASSRKCPGAYRSFGRRCSIAAPLALAAQGNASKYFIPVASHGAAQVLIREDSADGVSEEEDEEHTEGDASLLWEVRLLVVAVCLGG